MTPCRTLRVAGSGWGPGGRGGAPCARDAAGGRDSRSPCPSAGGSRTRALERFASTLGLPPIAAIRQTGGRARTTARFSLELADGRRVNLGGVGGLLNRERFAQATAVALGAIPPVDDLAFHQALRDVAPAIDVEVEVDSLRPGVAA